MRSLISNSDEEIVYNYVFVSLCARARLFVSKRRGENSFLNSFFVIRWGSRTKRLTDGKGYSDLNFISSTRLFTSSRQARVSCVFPGCRGRERWDQHSVIISRWEPDPPGNLKKKLPPGHPAPTRTPTAARCQANRRTTVLQPKTILLQHTGAFAMHERP